MLRPQKNHRKPSTTNSKPIVDWLTKGLLYLLVKHPTHEASLYMDMREDEVVPSQHCADEF